MLAEFRSLIKEAATTAAEAATDKVAAAKFSQMEKAFRAENGSSLAAPAPPPSTVSAESENRFTKKLGSGEAIDGANVAR